MVKCHTYDAVGQTATLLAKGGGVSTVSSVLEVTDALKRDGGTCDG
jgi:hypothetical protein